MLPARLTDAFVERSKCCIHMLCIRAEDGLAFLHIRQASVNALAAWLPISLLSRASTRCGLDSAMIDHCPSSISSFDIKNHSILVSSQTRLHFTSRCPGCRQVAQPVIKMNRMTSEG